MIDLRQATFGWYRSVLAPNTIVGLITGGLAVIAVAALACHHAFAARWAAALFDFSRALPVMIGAVSLIAGAYGLQRGFGYHPALDDRYHEWLRATPWAPGITLPKGPITPTWQDGLFLAAMTVVTSLYADATPNPTAARLGPTTAMAAGYALSWTAANLVTRNYLAVYGTLFTGALVTHLLFATEDSAIAVGLVAAAGVAFWGVRSGMATYPWDLPTRDKHYLRRLTNPDDERDRAWQQHAVLGWPYMHLLRPPRDCRAPLLQTVIETATLALWVALLGRFTDGLPKGFFVWMMLFYGGLGLVFGKFFSNVPLVCASFCLGERFVRRRPILRRHDRLLAEPLILAGAMLAAGSAWMHFEPGPSWVGAALTAGLGLWLLRRLGRPVDEAFYTGPQAIQGRMLQRAQFERLASPGD